jgi:cytochrome P450
MCAIRQRRESSLCVRRWAHRCLDSRLARHELGVVLAEWHDRIPEYRIPDGADLSFQSGLLALTSLPLEADV